MGNKGYDGSQRHELRDPQGALKARGTVDFCYDRLAELSKLSFETCFKEGWSIMPVDMGVIEASGE